MVRRIFVEKKRGFDVEAQNLLTELTTNLNLGNVGSLRVFHRYDVENIDDELFDTAVSCVFSEPGTDEVYTDDPQLPDGTFLFATEYLPGQYDQRADSAEQCIRILDESANPVVRYATLISMSGELSEKDKEAIEKYCINPVDSREASLAMPESLDIAAPGAGAVSIIEGFRRMDKDRLRALSEDLGLAMRLADLEMIQGYFRNEEERNPTVTEIKVLDTYWSDHCRHSTFLSKLIDITFEEGSPACIEDSYMQYCEMREELGMKPEEKPVCLMDIATIGAKYMKNKGMLGDLDESDEINACSIKVKAKIDDREEDWLVMFKNETHNHPTEIEPFGGAATCLGGAIRDPLSGRSYVYQSMRITGSGDPRVDLRDTLPGKLPQYRITREAARGFSSYGNQIGLATGLVNEIYHSGYIAKRMEIGAVIGAAPAENVRREKPVAGDVVLIVGGRTGRDGIGGATGSSKEHDAQSVAMAGAEVQKGNPPIERNLQRLFAREEPAKLIKKCNDFGAGGVAVAIGELADGLEVDLDKVPKKYEGLDGTELAISESQERMAVLLAASDADKFMEYAREENLEATPVATVTDDGRFRMTWRGETILDLSREFIDTNGARANRGVTVKSAGVKEALSEIYENRSEPVTKDDLLSLIEDISVCGRRGLSEMFDSTIGRGSVLMPFGGKAQLSVPCGMASKLPVRSGDSLTATLMSYGFDPDLSTASPWHGAVYAVIDSLTKITALGGDAQKARLSFQEYYEKLGKVPERWGKPFAALLGALTAQRELGAPAIGGKDSMSGTFSYLDVPPTLVSFAVATTEVSLVLSPEFKKEDSALILLKLPMKEEYIPDFDCFAKMNARVHELTSQGKILSIQSVGKGGVFSALCNMAIGNGIGAEISVLDDAELLAPFYGSMILEIDADSDIDELFAGLPCREIGRTNDGNRLIIDRDYSDPISIKVESIRRRWDGALSKVFPTDAKNPDAESAKKESEEIKALSYDRRAEIKGAPAVLPHGARPRVFIPVFPGTNCEVDSERAFTEAGALVNLVNFINLTGQTVKESLSRTAAAIRDSNIVMIPGGFSAGDEPEGSAKFIAAVFRNKEISEAVSDLLEQRDGLILGVCNGFQALIKLGLLPFGRIESPEEVAKGPTLTYNLIGRHQSRLVRTRVSSLLSPWLAGSQIGDVYTVPISHGEGRFVADDEVMRDLIESGQIAMQYSDRDGNPSMDISVNPNGSRFAVEGITSPDGRVFGKMGHIERVGKSLYKNVPGNYESDILRSGVNYYK